MKPINNLFIAAGIALVVGTALAQNLGPTLPARAQIGGTGQPNTYTNLVVTNSIAAQTTNTLASQPMLVVPNYDYGLEVNLVGPGRSDQGSNAWIAVNGTVDGTNFMTNPLFLFSLKMAGSNGVRFYTNFPASTISSLYAIQLQSLGNTDTNYITNALARLTRAKKPVQPPGLQ